ncbi:19545_t:CDS:1, partial [Racocetra persica]
MQKTKINNVYFTNTENWYCSCLGFLKNWFMLCKHLVQASTFDINPSFFYCIKRQEVYPFIYLTYEKILNNLKENSKEDLIQNSIENLLDSSQQ